MRTISCIVLVLITACASRQPATPAPPDLRAQATAFFEHYAVSLRNGERARIASYYMPTGATIILNGNRRFLTSAEIDARRISVTVQDGLVTLNGSVNSWAERLAAEHAVWRDDRSGARRSRYPSPT